MMCTAVVSIFTINQASNQSGNQSLSDGCYIYIYSFKSVMDKMCEFLERLWKKKQSIRVRLYYESRPNLDFRRWDDSGNNVKNLDHRCPRVGQGRSSRGRSGRVGSRFIVNYGLTDQVENSRHLCLFAGNSTSLQRSKLVPID